MMDSLVASIRLWSTRFGEAEELSRKALHAFRQLGDRFGAVLVMGPRMRALVALGRGHEAERGIEEALTISESFGDLAFPAMTAAGAAVHMGLGERTVAIAELAVERTIAMGAEGSETRVTLVLALCQSGRPDEALILLDQVDPSHPYAAAILALASAMIGDAAASVESASVVDEAVGATYLDRVIAGVAAAAAEVALGELDAASERIAAADAIAADAGDVVARALVRAIRQALAEGSPAVDTDHLGLGWRRVVELLGAAAGSS
jgi:tetratricopeptide (TPR) repeat protein